MGLQIDQEVFAEDQYQAFSDKLQQNLSALKKILKSKDFGAGPASVGAEVELYIVNEEGNPLAINQQLANDTKHPQVQVELNRFNIEYNLKPQLLSGSPFSAMTQEMEQAYNLLESAAQAYHGRVLPIGILPTLTLKNFAREFMTDIPRYRALSQGLKRLRGDEFSVHIDGKEPLSLKFNEVTLEGANTSCQFHWRVSPSEYSDTYNALQLVTPIALGLAANSPTFLGHHLWHETRIALFKQAVDIRHEDNTKDWRLPGRVSFGTDWVRKDAWEIFAHSVAMHPPLLPIINKENPEKMLERGELPNLAELCLHLGSTWPWNRAIYDAHQNGHLRIEMRALPAGPTWQDMSANGAFLIGAATAVMPQIDDILTAMTFKYAEHNFYEAAQHGIDAKLIWPCKQSLGVEERPLIEIARELLPKVSSALKRLNIDEAEIEHTTALIKGRIDARQTGASWQVDVLDKLTQKMSATEALHEMLELYIKNLKQGQAVHEWSNTVK